MLKLIGPFVKAASDNGVPQHAVGIRQAPQQSGQGNILLGKPK